MLDDPGPAVGQLPGQGGRPVPVQDQPGVDRQVIGLGQVDSSVGVQVVDDRAGHVERRHAREARVDRELGAVLLCLQPHRGRLHAHRQVLRHDDDIASLGREVERDREDARVVVTEPEAHREPGGVGVVELDPQDAAVVVECHGDIQASVLDAQVIEQSQRRAGEIAEFRVVALGLQLADDHDRQDDLVLGEPQQGAWIAQQHRRVDHVGLHRQVGSGRVGAGGLGEVSGGHRRRHSRLLGARGPAVRSDPSGSGQVRSRTRRLADPADPTSRPSMPRRLILIDAPDRGARRAVTQSSRLPGQANVARLIAARWHRAAATVQAWKISWKPNHSGEGLGRLRAYTTAPAV